MANLYICGVDEVGRGALAGPIMAVAALFECHPKKKDIAPLEGLRDSKDFSDRDVRIEMFHQLTQCAELVNFGIGIATVAEINEQGINEANELVFVRAVAGLRKEVEPDFYIVDGDKPICGIPTHEQKVEAKADAKYWQVSAASILAKVLRDQFMTELHAMHPQYKWVSNMGYGSEAHLRALHDLGSTIHHRTKFIRKVLNGKK